MGLLAPHTSIAQKSCFIPPNYLFSTPGDKYKQKRLYLSTESLCSLLYGAIAVTEQLFDRASKLQGAFFGLLEGLKKLKTNSKLTIVK